MQKTRNTFPGEIGNQSAWLFDKHPAAEADRQLYFVESRLAPKQIMLAKVG